MRMHLIPLFLLGASVCLSPGAPAQDSTERSDLRVLLVGNDPANLKVTFADLAKERTLELYGERTAAFEALLKEHFENVTVVFGADYEASMSEAVDVTLFDTRPEPLASETKTTHGYEQKGYLPHDFSWPAVMIAENSPLIGEPLGLKLDWL